MYASDLFEQNKPRVVVTYPGRFQPFHQGHAGVFSQLQKKFGAENVFVLTSNDTSSAKSPFNFSDKYQLMTAAGIPANHIVETNKMYILPDGIDPRTTIFVTAVGGPDKDRLNPDTFTKRDQKDKDGNVTKPAGSPSYYRTWGADKNPVTADQHGYVIVIPEIQKNVELGGKSYDASHGTEVRQLWNMVRNNPKQRAEFLKQLYKNAHQDLIAVFNKIPEAINESLNEFANDKWEDGDPRSRLIGAIAQLLKAGKKVDFFVPGIRGHVSGIGGQGDWVNLKRWNKPYSKINYSLALDSSDDNRFALKMIKPDYYQVVEKKDLSENFDAAEFHRHMEKLRAREELKKTDPMRALVAGMIDDEREKERLAKKKRPDDDSISINDPRHPSYGALHNPLGDTKIDEDSNIAQPGQLVSIIQAPRILDLLPGETFEVRSSNGQGVTLKHGMGTKFDNVIFPHGTYKIVRAQGLKEFAPDEGGGARKFIPWTEFIEQLKQILHKDFDCKENIVKSTIKARFVPHDPMEFGPTMLYSYYETRAGGRNKGAISTRGSIQVGKYFTGGLFGQEEKRLLTSFNLLKGHPFERHFDLTLDNIYKIANIIQGNTEGALEFKPEQVAEGSKIAKYNIHAKAPKPKNQQEYDAIEKYKADLAKSYQPKKTQGVAEGSSGVSVKKWANQVRKEHGADVKFRNRKEGDGAVDSVIAKNSQGETVGVYNRKTGYPTVYEPKHGMAESAAAHCDAVAKKAAQLAQFYMQSDNLKSMFTVDEYIRKKLGIPADEIVESFNSKQEVINYFVSKGKPAAAGAAAWERGWRGGKTAKPATKPKQPQQRYWWQDKDDVAEDAAGVGVVAKNKKMARDPRYSMSITKDVKPNTPKDMLRAFRLSETWNTRKRIAEGAEAGVNKQAMSELVKKFMPIAMEQLKIDKLPPIVLKSSIEAHDGQATFGRFDNDSGKVYLAIANRHPIDILRTLAHELVHYKQNLDGKMYPGAGETGSPIENEAHVVAGVIMRHFNKKYPDAIQSQQVEVNEDVGEYARTAAHFIPGVGQALSAYDVAGDLKAGNYKDAAMSALGFIPGVRGVQINKAAQVADVLNQHYNTDNTAAAIAPVKPAATSANDQFEPVDENFADGKNPQDKGDSKRYNVPTKASVSTLRKVAKQGGRKGQLAHWMANMKAGKAKKNG